MNENSAYKTNVYLRILLHIEKSVIGVAFPLNSTNIEYRGTFVALLYLHKSNDERSMGVQKCKRLILESRSERSKFLRRAHLAVVKDRLRGQTLTFRPTAR